MESGQRLFFLLVSKKKKPFSFFGTGKPSYKTVYSVAFPSKTWNCFVSCSFYVGTRKNGLDYFFFKFVFYGDGNVVLSLVVKNILLCPLRKSIKIAKGTNDR